MPGPTLPGQDHLVPPQGQDLEPDFLPVVDVRGDGLVGRLPADFDKRGSFHYNLGHYEKALKDFSEAVRLDPKQPAYLLHRGSTHQALGHAGEAAADFAKAKATPASRRDK